MAINPFDLPQGDRRWQVPLDKILLGIGISYLGLVILWLSSQQAGRGPVNSAVTPSPAQERANRDRLFISYLQQSLKTLDRNRADPSPQNLPVPLAPYSHPSNLAPINHASLTTQLIPHSNLSPGTPLPAAQPIKPASLTQILLPPPPQIPSPQRPTTPSSPGTVPVLSSPPHHLPPPTATPMIAASQTSDHHSLVGLLESGDQSTVLVTFNGITRRFVIGETLGSSGWRLVSVGNQRAIISRNGVTRSLDVGQGF